MKNNIVIGTFSKHNQLVTWEKFVQILQTPDIKFVESNIIIQNGFFYDGKNFIEKKIEENKINILNANKTNIYHESKLEGIVCDYITYIIEILHDFFKITEFEYNILVNINEKIITKLMTLKIGINTEQMIISENSKNFILNTTQYDYFNGMNFVIDYSIPNINFIKFSGINGLNIFYIAPAIYKSVVKNCEKTINTLTTFVDIFETQSRRINFLNNLNLSEHKNLNDCFNFEIFKEILMKTKILINVHRSEYEHTFEELRVLPALMCRVIVISEISPFSDSIPYNNLIIWVDYDSLVTKIHEVIKNYDYYYNNIFTENNVNLLNNIHSINKNTISNLFKNIHIN